MEECPLDNSSAAISVAQNQTEVFVDKHGRLFPVIWSVRPIVSSMGRGMGAVIEFRDVTEESAKEQERLAAILESQRSALKAEEAARQRKNMTTFIDYLSRTSWNGFHRTEAADDSFFCQMRSVILSMAYVRCFLAAASSQCLNIYSCPTVDRSQHHVPWGTFSKA